MMRDFDKLMAEQRRRHQMMTRFVFGWFVVVLLLMVATGIASIALLLNPEMLGEYIGRIGAGFEASRN